MREWLNASNYPNTVHNMKTAKKAHQVNRCAYIFQEK